MIKLSKEESVKRINLRKDKIISLKKEDERLQVNARVGLVLDCSGSMIDLYKHGNVQEIIERIIPLALEFTQDKALDLWIFDDSYRKIGQVTMDSFYGLTDRLMSKYSINGGTCYAPVLGSVDNFYVTGAHKELPAYVIFVTDGDNQDRASATGMITSMARHPIFIQFVGIGDWSFDYLEKLDEMEGRYVDNANFFSVNDLSTIGDDELYRRLLKEFPVWLEYPEVKEMLAHPEALQPVQGGLFSGIASRLNDLGSKIESAVNSLFGI